MTAYEATSYLIDVVLDEWEVRLCMIIPSLWIECFQELYISSIQKHKFIFESLKQIVTPMPLFGVSYLVIESLPRYTIVKSFK